MCVCARVPVQVEDICQVRMIILALPEVPRFMPTTIRVHLVPELPNQVAELMALESAECTSGSGPRPFGLWKLHLPACRPLLCR